jgi:hypothetical protein
VGPTTPGWACVGAKVASVGAAVNALFAGYFLDSDSVADMAIALIGAIYTLGNGPAAMGLLFTHIGAVVSLIEAEGSIKKACK